ncbi:MAG: type IVB secretion system protein IcmH/DotU [Pseudomonadota bacterium]
MSVTDPGDGKTIVGAPMPTPNVAARTDRTIVAPRLDQSSPPQPGVDVAAALAAVQSDRMAASNPVLAASADLLLLLGFLRTGQITLAAGDLRDALEQSLATIRIELSKKSDLGDRFVHDALYLLAATADDIAQTLPGHAVQWWRERGLAAVQFDDVRSDAGFFKCLERLAQNGDPDGLLRELGLVCLLLGFEGQYRSASDGAIALSRWRAHLHGSVRAVRPGPPEALSRDWMPVIPRGRGRRRGAPLWVFVGVGGSMIVALYAALGWTLTQESIAAQRTLIGLHRPAPKVQIVRSAPPALPVPPAPIPVAAPPAPSQAETLRAALADTPVTIAEEGDFLVLRMQDGLSFGAGAARLLSPPPALAEVARVLEAQPGQIVVEGHSDNIPLSGRGRYKTNAALSEARAAEVAAALAPLLRDPSRLRVAGAGATKPLDPADTAEARARNRRVDILLRREDR